MFRTLQAQNVPINVNNLYMLPNHEVRELFDYVTKNYELDVSIVSKETVFAAEGDYVYLPAWEHTITIVDEHHKTAHVTITPETGARLKDCGIVGLQLAWPMIANQELSYPMDLSEVVHERMLPISANPKMFMLLNAVDAVYGDKPYFPIDTGKEMYFLKSSAQCPVTAGLVVIKRRALGKDVRMLLITQSLPY